MRHVHRVHVAPNEVESTALVGGQYVLVGEHGRLWTQTDPEIVGSLWVAHLGKGEAARHPEFLVLWRLDARATHDLWVTRDGRTFLIERMSQAHLENCLVHLDNALRRGPLASRQRAEYSASVGRWVERINREIARRRDEHASSD